MRRLSFIILIIFIMVPVVTAQSPHGKSLKYDCSDCHRSDTWKVLLNKIKFNHSQTEFDLEDQHKNVSCVSCHKSLIFSNEKAKQNCFSCHKDIHQNSVGLDCENCHSTKSWLLTDIDQIHVENRFPLTGIHKAADCIQCHTKFNNLNFEPIGVSCYDCHYSNFVSATQPNHVAAGYSTNCENCHSINATVWTSVNVQHDFFPLTGGHSIPNCFLCHETNKVFSSISPECYSCHKKDYDASLNPNHKLEAIPTDCIQCHNINSFVPSTFQHDNTAFPLTGKHIIINCKDCHSTGFNQLLSTDCYSCHQKDYEATADPNHLSNSFSTDCSLCHTTNDWTSTTFDHSNTAFPLQGAHTSLDCKTCHSTGYKGTPTDCYSCHESNFNATVNPNHVSSGFPTDCDQCHTQNAWIPSTFDHNNTAFPLQGAHTSLDCKSCHSSGFKGTPTDCYSCHKSNYDGTTDPNHIASGFSTDCVQCHSQNAWKPATFDHNNTAFPLQGAHISLDCKSCHSTGYKGTPTDCYSCHKTNFDGTTDPNHVTSGFTTDCLQCHSQNAWKPATFDHNNTAFPLQGAHTSLDCKSCHSNGYKGTPTDCYSCHKTNFDGTTDPNHVASGFTTDCLQCHTQNAWKPATFDHSNTAFPLVGAHTKIDCISCHSTGYKGTPTECVQCHLSNYNSTTEPNHTASGISTDCNQCHSQNAWKPASFDHGFYPLSGPHMPVSMSCIECHSLQNFQPDCWNCHTNDFYREHKTGDRTDCYSCHSTNNWDTNEGD